MSTTDVLPDQADRDAAATLLADNAFIEAGAGTGKSTTLVARILNTVTSPSLLPVTSIAAITFTEKAAAELRGIWVVGNEYLQAAAPWSAIKTDPARAEAIIRLSLNLIRVYAILSRPFIPDAAAAMMGAMGSEDWTWPDHLSDALRTLQPGHGFTVPENMFRKITDEERADWQQRFSGVRA